MGQNNWYQPATSPSPSSFTKRPDSSQIYQRSGRIETRNCHLTRFYEHSSERMERTARERWTGLPSARHATSDSRGPKPPCTYVDSWEISLYSKSSYLSVLRWRFHANHRITKRFTIPARLSRSRQSATLLPLTHLKRYSNHSEGHLSMPAHYQITYRERRAPVQNAIRLVPPT